MKILWYISGNNAFFSRLVDSESVWLYTDWKKHTFQRYSKPENFSSDANTVKEVLRLFLGIYENQFLSCDVSLKKNEALVKCYLQLLLGMPVLPVRETGLNKLDNLYRHNNIYGFTYGKRHLWRILGVIESVSK